MQTEETQVGLSLCGLYFNKAVNKILSIKLQLRNKLWPQGSWCGCVIGLADMEGLMTITSLISRMGAGAYLK